MRSVVLCALLVGALFTPTATAAETLLSDAADDVQWVPSVLGQGAPPVPAAGPDFIKGNDLISLAVAETEETLVLTVGVTSMAGTPQATIASVLFTWNGKDYAARFGYFTGELSTAEGRSFAYLMVAQGTDWDWVGELAPPIVSREAGTISADVPKVYVLDAMRRMPGRGDSVLFTQVISDGQGIGLGLANLEVYDAMPDEPTSVPFVLQHGDLAQGNVILTAPERVRVSNGGSTTFVFQADVRNTADAEQSFALSAVDLPEGWTANVQSPLRVPAKESRGVSLLVSVPFAHDHGGYSSFNFSVQSESDPGTLARMRMGVLHTPVPQPAGHHSDLFLHGRYANDGALGEPLRPAFNYAYGWMNTVEDHSEDSETVAASGANGDTTLWFIGLDPGLLMGLDFDLERLGSLDGEIIGGRTDEVQFSAALYYYRDTSGGGEAILLAEAEPVTGQLDVQNPTPFSFVLTPTLESDYLAYAPDTYLYLELGMTSGLSDEFNGFATAPRLMVESFKMSLPLNEYHDRLTGATEAANAVEIVAKGAVEKAGRAGAVFTYDFDVRNVGPDDTYVFDLAGNDVAHATLVPAGEIPLVRGASRLVTLAVEIPMGSNPGQEFEVLLFVHSKDDPSKMAIARTKTRVTDLAEDAMPDESAQLLAAQARENEAPGIALPLALLAVAAVALVARRRR